MLNANAHKNFTASGDREAELLLENVLAETGSILSGTNLCVVLGGSYGRGDGGVRQDRENGILYNDLDFFVFAEQNVSGADKLLKEIAEKYEAELKVDIDFSRIMSVKDIKKNSNRLMMQELKRGYHPVCGKDLLAEYLPEIPAENLPYSEACRLLLNRGMGLLLAAEKISADSDETDFILRNLCKAILGAADALLIFRRQYRWSMGERLELFKSLEVPEKWKNLYSDAVEFKRAPNRTIKSDMAELLHSVRDMFAGCMELVCGKNCEAIYLNCRERDELSLKNYLKYCVKSRSFAPLRSRFFAPAVASLLPELAEALQKIPDKSPEKSKLYQHWLIFN